MKHIVFVLSLLFVLSSCAANVQESAWGGVDPSAESPKAPTAILHADTDFTESERNDIRDATEIWRKQTSGLAKIVVVYDLDFNSTSGLQNHLDDNHDIIIRATSDMDMVAESDGDHPGSVLAFVSPSGGIHNPWHKRTTVVFITDRYHGSRMYSIQVMIHEFGHLLGLPHLDSPQSIMFPSIIVGRSVCLKKADLAAFCQVNDCGTTKTYPCE